MNDYNLLIEHNVHYLHNCAILISTITPTLQLVRWAWWREMLKLRTFSASNSNNPEKISHCT